MEAAGERVVAQEPVLSESMGVTPHTDGNTTGNATHPHQPTQVELEHAMMAFYLVMFSMIGAQAALVTWRKRHKRSYDLATLMGLWLVPPVLCLQIGFYRFISIWVLYSSVTLYFIYQCAFGMGGKMHKKLPRTVYTWFHGVFRVSVGIGAVGYVLLLFDIFGAGILTSLIFGPGASIIFLWYGLYFGILTRDAAEVASDRIASALGTGRKLAVSVRDCGICGGELPQEVSFGSSLGTINGQSIVNQPHGRETTASLKDTTVQLSCKHLFHGDCIRGWLIVGKKDTCPTCWEKVDTKALYADRPWETTNIQWIQMLDMLRYLVAWNPLILFALHFVLHWLHLDEEQDQFENQNSTLS